MSKYQGKMRWETLNPLLSVRQAELSPCVKVMGEAESEVNHVSYLRRKIMTHQERLKFMRDWLKDLNNIYPDENKKEIECLSWAIKECHKNESRRESKKNY